MKRVQYHRYGGPETMALEAFEPRSPGQGQVAVRVKAAAINPIDWKLRRGDLKMMTGRKFPRGMGSDFAGEVVAIGEGVSRFRIGDAVFGLTSLKDSGAFAEAVVTAEGLLAHKPGNLTFEDAACLPTTAVTAWIGLVDKAEIQPGQRVFVNGCTGGVGVAATQIARARGASVCGSCRALMMSSAKAAGVNELYDYGALATSTLRSRFDVVFDTAGTLPINAGLAMLAKGGVMIDINVSPWRFVRALVQRRLKPVVCAPRADIMDGIAALAARGALRQPIAERTGLDEAVNLLRRFEESRQSNGKGVVLVA